MWSHLSHVVTFVHDIKYPLNNTQQKIFKFQKKTFKKEDTPLS